MRIVLLTQWFDPEPTFKGLLFAKQLSEQGHDVEVITGFPNYPGGRIYSGYSLKLYQKENHGNVVVHRVPLYPNHDRSALKRILNYVSFAASSLLFGLFGLKRADLIYVYHPPMTVGLSAALLSMFRRIPFVYDIQDLWPDTLAATGMVGNEKVLKIVSWLCDWIYKRATKLVVLSPGFRAKLIERGVPAEKIEVIYNWCDEEVLRTAQEFDLASVGLSETFNILFAGTMGKAQALDAVLDAAKIVAQHNSRVRFVFVGGGIELDHLKNVKAKNHLENVVFLPRMEMSTVGGLLSSCDALLVHLKKDPLFEITVPSKTQAYLAVGKPIIMGVPGDAADIVRNADAGICVESENAQAIASAALELAGKSETELSLIGKRGRTFYESELSLYNGIRRFSEVFSSVLSSK